MTRIKTLLYEERLTLEGAKKRLAAESRGRSAQLELGVKDEVYGATLKRLRARLLALRARLAEDHRGGRP